MSGHLHLTKKIAITSVRDRQNTDRRRIVQIQTYPHEVVAHVGIDHRAGRVWYGPLIYEVSDGPQFALCVNGELSYCIHWLLKVVLSHPIQDVIHLGIQFLCLPWLWILKLLKVISWGQVSQSHSDIQVISMISPIILNQEGITEHTCTDCVHAVVPLLKLAAYWGAACMVLQNSMARYLSVHHWYH